MNRSRIPRQFFICLILSLMAVSCDIIKKDDPAPEKVCKLLYDGGGAITYEYDSKDQLIRVTDNQGTRKLDYDENGYLIQELWSTNNMIKYQYANGLLIKITYTGFYNKEASYEYDSQKKLTKQIDTYVDGTTTTSNYNNGKQISFIRNERGIITQPYQYENGRVIRLTLSNKNYTIYEYDAKGRMVKQINYDKTGKTIDYWEHNYRDGQPIENANPRNFFKGFPDEIKNISSNGLQTNSGKYAVRNNLFTKFHESKSNYVLNAKGYVVSRTSTRYDLNTAGVWITGNPYKITYAYINCDE